MRHRLRLAHGGYLEQRQAHHRHSCALHPWDLRYVKEFYENRHSVLIWNHHSQLLPAMPFPLVSSSVYPLTAQLLLLESLILS
jgi:hypothetical protein